MPDPRQIFFLHIPRTAGGSLNRFFFDTVGEKNVFRHGINGNYMELGTGEVERYRVIGGHVKFQDAHWSSRNLKNGLYNPRQVARRPRRIYCSIVREPTEALLSHFDFVNRTPGHDLATRGSLDEAVQNREKFIRISKNLQCSYLCSVHTSLCGIRHAVPAIPNIQRHPFVVGTFDRLDAFVEVVSDLLGVEGELPHLHAAPDLRNRNNLPPILATKIDAVTHGDRLLYDFVKSRGVHVNL